nr:hypothetical protein Iba_chr02aCG11250 [Ipomoea batatas]
MATTRLGQDSVAETLLIARNDTAVTNWEHDRVDVKPLPSVDFALTLLQLFLSGPYDVDHHPQLNIHILWSYDA